MIKVSRLDKIAIPLVLLAGGAYAVHYFDPFWRPDPRAALLVAEAKDRSKVMDYLHDLTQNIGARVTGSPQLEKAEKWGVRQFKEMGIEDVRPEEWKRLDFRWSRGKKQGGRMVSPEQFAFDLTTPAWMPGTRGPEKAEIVMAPTTHEEAQKRKAELKGKWILIPKQITMEGPGKAESQALTDAVTKLGVKGRVYGGTSEHLYTAGAFSKAAITNRDLPPRFILRNKAFKRIQERLKRGQKVVLEFDVENHWSHEPIAIHNVIADIKGSERPDEIVLFGAHLDSWDSPGSQGALDNGVGVAVTLEAARLLKTLNIRPKRTIRFALWTGEEQGIIGSANYADVHLSEMPKYVAAFTDDGGTGYHGGYWMTPSMERDFRRALAPVLEAFPDKPIEFLVSDQPVEAGGSDHAPFRQRGVPAFAALERGKNAYGLAWHTDKDRYELADKPNLIQSAADWAALALYFGNSSRWLERPPASIAPE